MNMKPVVAGLMGLVVGVLGYYLVGRSPSVVHPTMQPTTPTNVALIFDSDVTANSLYALKSLMPQATRRHFTAADWTSLRRWIGKRGSEGYGLATYEVLTFPNHRSVTLWLTTPIGSDSPLWQVQQVVEGTHVPPQSSSSFVASTHP